MKMLEEWFFRAPWGDIAMASWGDRKGKPVLLVHGRQDSMSTFIPLLKYLPQRYYYVALDLPGNGKSDAFPTGVMITRLQAVSAVDVVLRYLKWNSFTYIGHSMGAELGMFYNTLHPGKISKLILLDVKPGLQRLQITDLPTYFKAFYEEYYSNYTKYTVDDRKYTKEEALSAVMKARGMTRDQAEIILERNLIEIGNNKYRLSWDRRQKVVAPINFLPDFYIEIFSKNMPPSLFINTKHSSSSYYEKGKDAVDRIYVQLQKFVKDVYMVDVDGSHDAHFTNPERLESHVCEFLERDFDSKSKL